MNKLSNKINKYCEYFTGFLLAILTIIILIQVFARRFFGNSLSWTEESARFLFIWIIIVGASIGIKEGFHVAINILKDKLKEKPKALLNIIINFSVLFFSALLLIAGITLSISVSKQLSPAIRINMFWIYISVPISALIMIIHNISELTSNFRQLKSK